MASEDATTVNELKVFQDKVDTLSATVVANVPADLCQDRHPGQGKGALCNGGTTSWKHGGAVCQISAEAFLHVDRRADIGINNGGGCRKDIAKGSFTINHAYEVLPFSNQLETLTMTGAKV